MESAKCAPLRKRRKSKSSGGGPNQRLPTLPAVEDDGDDVFHSHASSRDSSNWPPCRPRTMARTSSQKVLAARTTSQMRPLSVRSFLRSRSFQSWMARYRMTSSRSTLPHVWLQSWPNGAGDAGQASIWRLDGTSPRVKPAHGFAMNWPGGARAS